MGKGLVVNYGGFDLYVSYFENGSWTAPKNLGAGINGPGNEVAPFIDDIGVIYFSSDGHKGFGGFDVFRAEISEDSKIDLRNLGYGVNSSSDDIYFVFDLVHETAYFCSNRNGGSGNYDIYSAVKLGDLSLMPKISEDIIQPKEIVEKKVDVKKSETVEQVTVTGNKATNLPSVNINTEANKSTESSTQKTEGNLNKLPFAENVYIGSIRDAVTKERIEAVWIYVKNKKTGEERKLKTSKYGEYSIILDPETQYDFKCSKEGYVNFSFEIATGDGERRTLLGERDMQLSPTSAKSETKESSANSNEKFLRGPQKDKLSPTAGYLIQVGVFKNINKATEAELSTLANIITEPYKDSEAKIYRLGVFAEETHAKEVLEQVQT